MIRARTLGAAAVAAVAALAAAFFVAPAASAHADGYTPVSGAGSTSAQTAIDLWRRDVARDLGLTVDYAGVGSLAGGNDLLQQTVDFAVTDLPLSAASGDGPESAGSTASFDSIPLVGHAIALAYNLQVEGKAVTDLRLSGEAVAGIFSGSITRWNDPILRADNPGVVLPDRPITPVVRADATGSSLALTRWMTNEFPGVWTHGASPVFPLTGGAFRSQSGSLGVAGYVSQSFGDGSITYVENAYALKAGLSVAKVANAAGYYIAPTPNAVSIALRGASASDPSGVARSVDPRAYPVSTVQTMLVPSQATRTFTPAKGASVAAFLRHALCGGQRDAAGLGNAPLPLELVRGASDSLASVPGSAGGIDLDACANPTLVPGDTTESSFLTRSTPMPLESDARPEPGAATRSEVGLGARVTASDLFSLVASAHTVDFGDVPRDETSLARALGRFTVVDDRTELTGWTAQISVADFAGPAGQSGSIPASAVGFAPQAVKAPAGIVVGAAQAAGSSAYPAVLASADPGISTTVDGAVFDADLTLHVPSGAGTGTYRSTLTLTLVAR